MGQTEFPVAEVRDRIPWWQKAGALVWWVAGVCLMLALGLAMINAAPHGPEINVRFNDGHGLKPEDLLLYRGIEVGEVVDVALRDDLGGVDVTIELRPDATGLAREGSQFWVERPQLSLSRMSGLQTVVGAKYVGVIPGPQDGKSKSEFVGLESPPTLRQAADASILVHFEDGYGLSTGDVVKHRGIVVGEVNSVELDQSLQGVDVQISLTASGRQLARLGSRFWIERPSVSLEGIRGLDTIVGGRYVAVMPGPLDGQTQFEFEGLSEPPIAVASDENVLVIEVVAEERFGLERGAPVNYRGLPVGYIAGIELAADAHAILVRAVIDGKFRNLVRENSQFWPSNGVNLTMGLKGLEVEVDSLSSLAKGGIAFATPRPAGQPVEHGAQFQMGGEEPTGWQDWKPLVTAAADVIRDRIENGPPADDRPPAQRFLGRLRDALEDQKQP